MPVTRVTEGTEGGAATYVKEAVLPTPLAQLEAGLGRPPSTMSSHGNTFSLGGRITRALQVNTKQNYAKSLTVLYQTLVLYQSNAPQFFNSVLNAISKVE